MVCCRIEQSKDGPEKVSSVCAKSADDLGEEEYLVPT